MANAGERALAAATQLEKIGFVDFTVELVRGVYQVILNGSMEQLQAYADFVSKISKTLEEYQAEVLGASGKEELDSKADDYMQEVLELDPETETHTLNEEAAAGLKQHFAGITVEGEDGGKTIDDYLTDDNGDATITTESLRLLIVAKLKQSAKESYDLIKTVLKIGMQKVVVTNGEISTKLTFHVDATDTQSTTSNKQSRNASGWGLGAAVSGQYGGGLVGKVVGNFIGGSLSGGYSNNKINVSVVNEKSTAATNVNVDILGSVKIQFRTETFPSIEV